MKHKPFLTQEQWLEFGRFHGYCSEVVCLFHDGIPMSVEEMEAFEDDADICAFGMRINE